MVIKRTSFAKSKKRRILLIEPNYQNKYPPIGLMKISTYHKLLGDHVAFFKGDLSDLLIKIKLNKSNKALKRFDKRGVLPKLQPQIERYIRTKRLDSLSIILGQLPKRKSEKIEFLLRQIAYSSPRNEWDRIYITTLFTFYWKITIKTIEFAKSIADNDRIRIGGIMASLLTNEILRETGIKPQAGLLNTPGILDENVKLIVDELPLDYSIIDETDYDYPTKSAYFTYMTKGCTRKCSFCSVPKLEPTYTEKVAALDLFNQTKTKFGDQRNLMLMDNNVLASPKFPEVIDEIIQMGFSKDSIYVEPNMLAITIQNLRKGINDHAYTRKAQKLILDFRKRVKGDDQITYDKILEENRIDQSSKGNKKTLIRAYKSIAPFYEKYRPKTQMKRYVDFNQGIDARYVNEENMALLGKIPIRPLRIAFDHIGIKNTYIKAVELAVKNGINDLSNYVLYNFQDKPDDFYERLRINVDLGKRLGVKIFSFPMKYVPLFGEEAKDRKYIGKHWNRKYLRAIQCILNTTKGIVAPGYDFFEMSFGKDFSEFLEILILPESYIINRRFFERNGLRNKWREDYDCLDPDERSMVLEFVLQSQFDQAPPFQNPKLLRFLSHYSFYSDDRAMVDADVKRLRKKFNMLIRKNIFVDLTLTHDFDQRNIVARV